MQKKKPTRIFALVRNRKVIVSRCSAVKLSAVVYSHLRGEHKQTQGHFDLEQNRPDLYVLEEVVAESYVTYRHLLAWIHAFETAGYTVLNDEEVLENSRDLHPETRQIFDRIQEMPLALHLEYSYCSSYRAGDYDQKRMTPKPPSSTLSAYYAATEKLSIRLSKAEKEILSGFAKSLNLSQRDALLYAVHRVMLCDDTTLSADQQVYSFQERHMHEIQKLKEKHAELSENAKEKQQKLTKQLDRYRKNLAAIQSGIRKYISYFSTSTVNLFRIEVGRYQNYIYRTDADYQYPAKEGFAVMRPHAVLWGRSPQVRFLVGETDQGESIMLRFYPTEHFIGIVPVNEQFGFRGSCWLVGWEKQEEDVMQLIFSLPLSVYSKYDDPMAVGTELGKLLWEIDHYN